MAKRLPPPKIAYTAQEVADALSQSLRTVRRLISSGELRTIRCGRSRRILAKSLDEYVKRGGSQ